MKLYEKQDHNRYYSDYLSKFLHLRTFYKMKNLAIFITAIPALGVLLYFGGLYCINVVFISALPFLVRFFYKMVKEELGIM